MIKHSGKSKPSSDFFHKLPREVRDQVFCYVWGNESVFTGERPIYDEPTRGQSGQRRSDWKVTGHKPLVYLEDPQDDQVPVITPASFFSQLWVSRQFCTEAMNIFYTTSNFEFDNIEPFRRLLNQAPFAYQQLIQNLTIYIPFPYERVGNPVFDEWLALLKQHAPTHLSGLRRLRIYVAVYNVAQVRLQSSKSLPLLQEALISAMGCYWTIDVEQEEWGNAVFQRVAEVLR